MQYNILYITQKLAIKGALTGRLLTSSLQFGLACVIPLFLTLYVILQYLAGVAVMFFANGDWLLVVSENRPW